MGVSSGCGEQDAGVANGCGCKEVYRFSHITYPYSSCIYLFIFAAASLLFIHKKNVFRTCSSRFL